VEDHDDFKGLESRWKLSYDANCTSSIRTQIGCAFRTSCFIRTYALNPILGEDSEIHLWGLEGFI
jgi:hypothetical protein